MLKFRDLAVDIDEPKPARMEQRTQPHVKAQIQQAAALLGVDETTFVTSVALERARQMRPDQNVVTIICDSGLKYLQGDLFSGGA